MSAMNPSRYVWKNAKDQYVVNENISGIVNKDVEKINAPVLWGV